MKQPITRPIQGMPPVLKINHYRTIEENAPCSGLYCVKKQPFQDLTFQLCDIPTFQDHHFRTPLFNMAWQIFQHLTTANLINKTLAVAKCHIAGTKLYIRTAPSESKCIKREPRKRTQRPNTQQILQQ